MKPCEKLEESVDISSSNLARDGLYQARQKAVDPGNHPPTVGAGQATLLTLSDGHQHIVAESLTP